MSPNRIIVARFSPTGRTRRLMSMIAQGLAGTALPVEELDLTDRWEREEARTFGKGDLVFLGVPVYFGRVPLPMQSLAQWAGNGAAAVPVAAYGCRAHEDTLRELAAVLRAAGFVVPAGAAFPVEHSQFPEFGAGRPNEADRFSAGDFARRVFEALRDGTARFAPEFPGEGELRPYPKTGFVPMPDPVCRMCGRCAEKCPVGIDLNTLRVNSRDKMHNVPDERRYGYFKGLDRSEGAGKVGYFAGCMTLLTPRTMSAMSAIFEAAGEEVWWADREGGVCCGRPLKLSGETDAAHRMMHYNTELFRKHGITTLVTSCPICLKVSSHEESSYNVWSALLMPNSRNISSVIYGPVVCTK